MTDIVQIIRNTWYNKLGSSMLSGAIGGAINGGVYGFNRANATGANYWWGTKPEDWARNRNQWSLTWWEKPDVAELSLKIDGVQSNNSTCWAKCGEMLQEYFSGTKTEIDFINTYGNNKLGDQELTTFLSENFNYNTIDNNAYAKDLMYSSIDHGYPIYFDRSVDVNNNYHAYVGYKVKKWSNGNFKIIAKDPATGFSKTFSNRYFFRGERQSIYSIINRR